MPTLIRLIVILLVLGGIGYGAMYALTVVVEPKEKQVTIRIPARDLVPQAERDPLVRREIDTSRPVEVAPVVAPEVEALPPPANTDSDSVTTLQQGIE